VTNPGKTYGYGATSQGTVRRYHDPTNTEQPLIEAVTQPGTLFVCVCKARMGKVSAAMERLRHESAAPTQQAPCVMPCSADTPGTPESG
jgi:hypothetical protein